MEEPDRLQSMGLQRVRHDGATLSLSGSSHFFKVCSSVLWVEDLKEQYTLHSEKISLLLAYLLYVHRLSGCLPPPTHLFNLNLESKMCVHVQTLGLCGPTDCSLPGFSVRGIFRQEY